MKKNIFKNNWLFVLLLGILFAVGCSDLNETHLEYIKDGEEIYVGKPEEVYSSAGNGRIIIYIAINADPKIKQALITWNSGANEHLFDVVRDNEGIDTISVELTLAEGNYNFEVTLLDDMKHRSMVTEHSAVVYGDKYISQLTNRSINEIIALPDHVKVLWSSAEPGVIKTVFKYEDNTGEMKELTVLPSESELIIADYKIGGLYSLITTHKPDELALDEFLSPEYTSNFPSFVTLDRSLWQKVVLPTDAPLNCYGGSIENLWDGKKGSWYHSGCTPEDGIPHHFTIDLGIVAGLSKFRITPRQECCQDRNPKKFQVWGIQDIENAETTAAPNDPNWADDAIAKGWVLLLDTETDPSWNGSKADYDVEIPENISVKYIRFRFLEAYTGGQETALSEFVFWARSIN